VDVALVNTGSGRVDTVAPVASMTPEMVAQQRDIIQAVKAINKSEMFGQDAELTFQLDRGTKRPVVRLVDRETKEVIRQIPPEYLLRLAEDFEEAKED